MLLHRFEEPGLAHYSYAIGCQKVGRLAVIDPRRDVDVYLRFASEQGMSISYVLETHIHADYASGAVQLAEVAGAELCVSGYDEGETYQASFPHTDLFEGDSIDIGQVRLEVLHTPGHTPEHVSFLAYDESRSRDVPVMLFSGDFLFVGSVGRPDLLGETQLQKLAKQLYWSIQDKLDSLPDGLEVHPAHGAGSLCGAGMGSYPSSTLGFERAANPYLDLSLSLARFSQILLASLPPRPTHYPRMKTLNAMGPPVLSTLPGNKPLAPSAVVQLQARGHRILDVRSPKDFAEGHIPGSLFVGLGNSFSNWAGWIVPPDRPLILVLDNAKQANAAIRGLIRVGLDQIAGFLDGGIGAWTEAGNPLEALPGLSLEQLQAQLQADEVQVLDVRMSREWDGGHIEGARHVMLGDLPGRLNEVPEAPLAVICAGGYRSVIACSLLQADGRANVSNVGAGMEAWIGSRLPVAGQAPESSAPEQPPASPPRVGAKS